MNTPCGGLPEYTVKVYTIVSGSSKKNVNVYAPIGGLARNGV